VRLQKVKEKAQSETSGALEQLRATTEQARLYE
jgi:hypothetical protein